MRPENERETGIIKACFEYGVFSCGMLKPKTNCAASQLEGCAAVGHLVGESRQLDEYRMRRRPANARVPRLRSAMLPGVGTA